MASTVKAHLLASVHKYLAMVEYEGGGVWAHLVWRCVVGGLSMKVAATISEVPTLPTATNKKLVCAAQLDYKRPKVTM